MHQLQVSLSDMAGVQKMLNAINGKLGEAGGKALSATLLDNSFAMHWPMLETQLGEVSKIVALDPPKRDDSDKVNELLTRMRRLERRLGNGVTLPPDEISRIKSLFENQFKTFTTPNGRGKDAGLRWRDDPLRLEIIEGDWPLGQLPQSIYDLSDDYNIPVAVLRNVELDPPGWGMCS
jgi:hypothetical protein